MIQINQTIEHGYTVYKFEANNTEYEILTTDGVAFDVWSKRKSLRDATLKCYNSLAELAARSKALNNFQRKLPNKNWGNVLM